MNEHRINEEYERGFLSSFQYAQCNTPILGCHEKLET